jgi:flagellar motor switch protein FliM
MNDVLSQNEIEALLGNDTDGAIKNSSEPKHYDFSKNSGMVKNKFDKLEMVYEKFVRTFKVSLYAYFRKNIEVDSKPIQIVKADDYLTSLRTPTNINIISMNPLKGDAFLCLDSQLIYALVDKFFGGEGKIASSLDDKDFTPTEYRIINNILSMLFSDIQHAWEETHPVQFALVAQKINPSMLTNFSPFEYMIVKKFHFGLEGGGGDIEFAVPLTVFDPILEKLEFNVKKVESAENKEWENALRTEILEASVDVNCILATKKIKLGDVKILKKGDVITIDIPEFSNIKIGNIPVYETKFGTHEGHYAIKIQSKIN